MGFPKLVLICLAALAGCDRYDTESPHARQYGADPEGGVDAPIEADTYGWDWNGADADRDRRVGRAEWARGLGPMFTRMDADRDGLVTAEEFERAGGDRALYDRLDADARPGLDREELGVGWFDALDANDNDAIEAEEWPWKGAT